MAVSASQDVTKPVSVGMGQIVAGKPPMRMKAVLGSCIALVVYHPRIKAGAMAHIVLPDAAGRQGPPGKYANVAIPGLLSELSKRGTPPHGLAAKFAGGANMFKSSGPMQIGDSNAEAVLRLLEAAGIRVAGSETGGSKGRRVEYDCAACTLTIECAGQPPQTI